jgi:amino acid adenylation domain-containing protein
LTEADLPESKRIAISAAAAHDADFWIAAWAMLLALYTGESLVTFGAPQVYDFMGEGNNQMRLSVTLPVSVVYDGQRSFSDWIAGVRGARAEVHRAGPATFASIRQAMGLAANEPLFDSQVVIDDEPVGEMLSSQVSEETPPITLRISASQSPALEWDPRRFDNDAAARMAGHVETLVRALEQNPGAKCGELPLLTAAEFQQIVLDWNSKRAEYRTDRAIHEIIADQAAKTPGAIAVYCDGRELTYAELDRRSDALARRLVAVGVKPDTLVPLCVSRSVEMMIGIVGILKSGAGYAPLDENYPAEWLSGVLHDVASPVLVTQQRLDKLPSKNFTHVLVDDDSPVDASIPLPKAHLDHLAYAIYTSGSTGKPKGVLITHRNLLSSITARVAVYGAGTNNFLQQSSYAFDSSVAGIFWMLSTGGTLTIVPEEAQQDLTQLDRLVFDRGITIILCQPAFYFMLLDRWQTDAPPALRKVIVGGEVCLPKFVAQHQRQVPHATLYNEYGPTEGTVWSTVYPCDQPVTGAVIPIGRVIPNARFYLLDANRQPVPIGVAGEICLGGTGIARGYLNLPELTAQKFVANPFVPGERMYVTGDYARYLPDGNIEFLGRRDAQIKVRGFRVELGEIESVLVHGPGVNECAVVAREDNPGDQRLVAYVTMKPGAEFSVSALRHHVRLHLPEYMIPAAVVRLDAFPLTNTGKFDLKSLPKPDSSAAPSTAPFLAPGSALEKQIADIWKQVLSRDAVGIDDNFFEIGGHSFGLVKIHQQLQKALGREVPITDLFQFPTIRGFARRLDEKPADAASFGDKARQRAALQRTGLTRKLRPPV